MVDNVALSTFSDHRVNPNELGEQPSRHARIDGLPLDIWLYADKWPMVNTRLTQLIGSMAGLIGGFWQNNSIW